MAATIWFSSDDGRSWERAKLGDVGSTRVNAVTWDGKKFVLVGAPHTSNWDFAVFLGAAEEIGIQPSYLGKHSLFRWPLRRFMLDMGGIPIDRSKRANYVEQAIVRHPDIARKLVELFDRHGVSFVSVTQQFNTTTSMGRLTLNILLSFAQFEREVIGEEITMYRESPSDHIGDLISQALWSPDPLGNAISGNLESIAAIDRDTLLAFRDRHYFREDVIIAIAGPFDEATVLAAIRPHLPASARGTPTPARPAGSEAPRRANAALR